MECLEYLKQASINPKFGNNYLFEFKHEELGIQDSQDRSSIGDDLSTRFDSIL